MKIKYLGTAAAEGVPAFFCHCEVCTQARKQKGREFRTRSQAIIDDKLLIDFGPDTYAHLLQYDLDITELEHCLITHAHEDHVTKDQFVYRAPGFARLKEGTQPLHIYGSEDIPALISEEQKKGLADANVLLFHELKTYQPVMIAEYKVTAFPAIHGTAHPYFYSIEKDGKTILYAHDTDVFAEEVWEYFTKNQMHFDLVSMDCTEGKHQMSYVGHMNFDKNLLIKERMLQLGLADEKTLFVSNHFSHNGGVTYQAACELVETQGLIVSYDGLELSV